MTRGSSTSRWFEGSLVLLALVSARVVAAGPLPELDVTAGLRPSPAAKAEAARLRPAPGARLPGTPASFDARYDVPTLLRAAHTAPPATVAARPAGLSAEAAARRHLGLVAGHYRLEPADVDAASLRYVHDTGRGGIVVAFRQQLDGIEVFRDEVKVLMDRRHELVAVAGYIPGRALLARARSTAFALGPERAALIALEDFSGRPAGQGIRFHEAAEGGYELFDVGSAAADLPEGSRPGGPVRLRKTWFHLPDALVPAYYVELIAPDQAYSYVVDAGDGRLLFRHDIMASESFSYRVFAEGTGAGLPHDGPQGTSPSPHPTAAPNGFAPGFVSPGLLTLESGPLSTGDPWLAPGATTTSGNNVNAYADLVMPDGFGAGDLAATITSPGTFDRAFDPGLDPAASADQRMAAIAQLFYDNNFFHDWYYDSGFDEASGNGQNDNYGRGGLGGDAMRSEAQDWGGTNNANMSTPADGSPGRMQMYLFTPPGTAHVQVTAPVSVAGTYAAGTAAGFGPQDFNLSGELVLGVDGVLPNVNDGCQALTNAVAGRIVLIDRGNCLFTAKAQMAQNAGAAGLVIADNLATANPPGMGGQLANITIPVLTVTQATGAALENALLGGTVTLTLHRQTSLRRDGTVDNQIVAHEWGHFISNRLIGNAAGLSTSMGAGLGEGWADFHALLMTVRPEDADLPANADWGGTYAMGSHALSPSVGTTQAWYFGIRRCPYSTDMGRNGLTFKHIQNGIPLPAGPPTAFGANGANNAEVHNVGEVWCNMLWECYASLLRDTDRLTFAESQQRMRDYLVLSYKLTPNAPTLLEARDALLLAAWTNDPEDFQLFWVAFARRGAGAAAVAPDRFSFDNAPVVESYVTGGVLAALDADVTAGVRDCEPDGYLDNGEVARVRLWLTNVGSETLTGPSVTVSSSNPHVSFPAGATHAAPAIAPFAVQLVTIPVELLGAAGPELATITASYDAPGMVVPGPLTTSMTAHVNVDEAPSFTENVETLAPPWAPSVLAGTGAWRVIEDSPGDHHFLGEDPGTSSDHALTSPPLVVAPTGDFSFTFTHRYDFERDATTFYDGGVVEISADGGATWTDIGPSLSDAYADTLFPGSGNPLGARPAYVGQSADYPLFTTTTADLGSAYQGQTVRVRFRVGTDVAVAAAGWQVSTLTFANLLVEPFHDLAPDADDCTPLASGPQAPREIAFALSGANPASGPRTFRFGLPGAARVELSIHDVSGRRVATLAKGELPAGWHTKSWGANEDGAAPASGVYFARLIANGRMYSSRVVILR